MKSSFTLDSSETLLRLDQLLVKHFPSFSRSYFHHLIEKSAVLVNKRSVKKKDKLRLGDLVEIHFLPLDPPTLIPQPLPLDILFEDDHLIAINKPAGMVVHPAPGHANHTFAGALLHHCQKLQAEEGFDKLRPGIVHRLDKDTSGVLLAAKSYEAHQKLVEQFKQRKVKKKYLAICLGHPGIDTVNAAIKRHPTRRKEMTIDPMGKQAISHIITLKQKEGLALVEIEPETGRTHQIRVHLALIKKTPILGDLIYGSSAANRKFKVERQLLHAYQLSFQHPTSHQEIFLEAPPPEDLTSWIQFFD